MGGGVALHALAHGLPAKKAVLIAPNADLVLYSKMVARKLGMTETSRLSLQQRIERRFAVTWESIDSRNEAPNVTQPGLVIHDRDDKEIPLSMGAGIAKAWPTSRFIQTETLGHRRILSDPVVVGTVRGFLEV
jgi:pimeloyl-ACP methyl ester carboxylesterase